MKRAIAAIVLLLLAVWALPMSANAEAPSFSMDIPSYYEKINDYEWSTDQFTINGNATNISIKVSFEYSSGTQEEVFSDAALDNYKAEISQRSDFSSFYQRPIVNTSANLYPYFYTTYSTGTSAVILYTFYSENQSCTVRFVTDNPVYIASTVPEQIIDTLTFRDDFYTIEETPPAEDSLESEEFDESEESEDSDMTTRIIVALSFGIVAFAVLFIIAKKRKKATVTFTTAATENATPSDMPQRSDAAPEKFLEDETYIQAIKQIPTENWHKYDVLLAVKPYGWDTIKDWADYIAKADLDGILRATYSAPGVRETDFTTSYLRCGSCRENPELEKEYGTLTLAGISKTLRIPVSITWINQTSVLVLFTPANDQILMEKYVETMVRRSFGTDSAMKRGKPITSKERPPVEYQGCNVYIHSRSYLTWRQLYPLSTHYNSTAVIPLTQSQPVITLYDDGVKVREFVLQTEGNEDFSGKYFHISVIISMHGNPAVPAVQIDGFVSDQADAEKMTSQNVGYRMEGYFLRAGGVAAIQCYEMLRGQDLPMKALKYPGRTIPSNVRLVGVCPDCGKSFCFHGYAFYMMQNDVAYSDDGLSCCQIQEYNIDTKTWVYETDGKIFRYYNNFCCPHCGTPYIDYQKYPQNKIFGVPGCVHLGTKHYQSTPN